MFLKNTYYFIDKSWKNFNFYCKMFTYYWVGARKNNFKKIFESKEKVINNSTNIENICKITYEIKMLKSILLNDKENLFLNYFYDCLLINNYDNRELIRLIYRNNCQEYFDFKIIDETI